MTPRVRRCSSQILIHNIWSYLAPRKNTRFLITNLRHVPERVWQIYCHRGDSENRIKELKLDLCIDRTSCVSYLANQLLTAR
ncbi:MAG: hypothetical protein GY725_05680 [bacterium]|nr:hypothetical protein [bacterium]